MDINQLARALVITNNNEERKINEEYIATERLKANYCPALLNIACDVKYPPNVQLNAGIQLKNFIFSFWKYGSSQALNNQLKFFDDEKILVINEEDKNYIKAHILDALVYSTAYPKLMKQFNQCIKRISKLDYTKWNEFFMAKIVEFFNSKEDKKIYAAIIAYFQVSKIYEFEGGEIKEIYNKTFEIVNDYLLNFLNSLIPNFLNNEATLIIYKIIKIYFKSIQMYISTAIYDLKNFENWNLCILTIMRQQLPETMTQKKEKPEEIEELTNSIYWKLKKLCFQTTYRLYQKYGFMETLDKECLKDFTFQIETNYVKPYFEVNFETLSRSKVEFIPEHILCFIYKFLSQMISRHHLIPEIEKATEIILKDHVIQDTYLSIKDADLWTNDPKTYINKQFDITDNYYILRYSVCQFVKTLCTFRRKNNKGKPAGKPPYFEICYNYFVNILDIYEEQINKGITIDMRIKEGVLYILQSIAPSIIKNSKNKNQVEYLIERFILKEFSSNFGFLRERACTFIECFGEYKFTNSNLLHEITKNICGLLDTEKELPVKVMAAIAAPLLLKHNDVKELLSGSVANLLEIYLNLVNTVDLEEILDGLETIISRFNHQIKNYAVTLAQELIKMFKNICETEEEGEQNRDKLLVVEGILRTLLKLIELFVNDQDIFPKIEPLIKDVIHWGLLSENFEKFDDILDIIHEIVKKGHTISPVSWTYFPEIIFSLIGTEEELQEFKKNYPNLEFEGLGYENISDIVPVLCYYIVKDPNTFLTGIDKYNVSYLNRTIWLVHKIITLSKTKKEYMNVRYALKLLIVIIETMKGKIDEIVKEILLFLVSELTNIETKLSYKKALLETVASCFYYNPIIAINTIESRNLIEPLFELWILNIPNFKHSNELRRTLLAFLSILLVEPNNMNSLVKSNINMILNQIIHLASTLDIKIQKKLETTITKPDFDDEENEDEEELDKNIALAKASTLNDFKSPDEEIDEFLEEEEDEDDEDWDEFSNLNGITPADKVDEMLFIKEVFHNISMSNSNYYEQLMKLIDDESKAKLDNCIKKAENRLNR